MTSVTPDAADYIADQIASLAERHLAAAWGVADLAVLLERQPDLLCEVPGPFTRAVVLGVRLHDALIEGICDRPTPLYFHLYRQANYQLDRVAFELAGLLQRAGYAAAAVPASQVIARDPMRGHLSHKLLGWAAGIGWIGRSTLLVHPRHGARMRYVSVLTDAPLRAGTPSGGSCGECRRCVDACPAKAIREDSREFDLDACYAKLSEFSRLPGISQHICGICLKACGGKADK